MLTLLAAVPLIGLSAWMLAHAVRLPRVRVQGALAQIEAYGFDGPAEQSGQVAKRPGPMALLGSRLVARASGKKLEEQRQKLLGAGLYNVSAETFMGFRLVSAVGITILMGQLAASSGKPGMAVLLVVIGAATGWTLPQTIVSRRAGKRHEQIDRAMPELVDLLVVGVESGIGFNGAIQAAATRIDGPLGHELRLMLQEQNLGVSTSESLNRVLDRCDTPATRSFVRTITQGERLGISVGQVLRSLAAEMRKRRKAYAEEQAHKAPVKILFPLVFLIFPSIFIVLLTPAAISISQGLTGQ